ncbi:cytochrome c4 [Salinispirillum sp. LH 10-3-1]|uniref:Cytochrome c4 n=1 Tax=Salinispirillum sp. LH 10-3-1 TaxID=2952525 RepID=A0AB38YG27_9GAMM
MKKTITAALAVFGLVAFAQAEGDVARGEALSVTCSACHGTDGNSADAANPKLAGQNARYTFEQLLAFQTGDRVNAVMSGFAAPLSEQDMWDLAAFYEAQTGTVGEADAELVALGERIYRGGIVESGVAACIACHGPNGNGNAPAGFPRVSGQHAAYTAAQLYAFREGYRAAEPAADARMTDGESMMMRSVAYKMRDFEIEAVAAYIQGLH